MAVIHCGNEVTRPTALVVAGAVGSKAITPRSTFPQAAPRAGEDAIILLRCLFTSARQPPSAGPSSPSLAKGHTCIYELIRVRGGSFDRHYTGRGKWFALVQAIKHPLRSEVGTIKIVASVECETRPEAVNEARRLLAEHAGKITEDTEIEGIVVSELDDLAEGLKDRKSG